MIEVVEGPIKISGKDLFRVAEMSRENDECPYNKEYNDIYNFLLGKIMLRATEGYKNCYFNSSNCKFVLSANYNEALDKALSYLAYYHCLEIKAYLNNHKICIEEFLISWERSDDNRCGCLNYE